jgi:hypothetical protein
LGSAPGPFWFRAASLSLLEGARVGAGGNSAVSGEAVFGEDIFGGLQGVTIAGAGRKIVSGGCAWPSGSLARANVGVGAGRGCQVARLRLRPGPAGAPAAIKLSIAGLSLSATERTRSSEGFAFECR